MKAIKLLLLFVLLTATQCGDDENVEPILETKARWIHRAFETITSHPNIKAISWWHENFDNSRLRIDSSQESLDAYVQEINNPYFTEIAIFNNNKLIPPTTGAYHAAYPDFGGTEDEVTSAKITDFENLVGKDIAWAYFSNNWYNNIQFPSAAITIIHNAGKVPFIRIMPRTTFDEGPDPNYTMQKIIDGDFDTELIQWAQDAAATNIPLLVEFGTEVNGDWFPWSGLYNGAGELTAYGDATLADGPERFRDAYRHLIDICTANGGTNITWFFHVDAYGEPNTDWNSIANYYPGDNYIDWLGISVYGPQEPIADFQWFDEVLNDSYIELTNLSNKPIAVLEFAVTE